MKYKLKQMRKGIVEMLIGIAMILLGVILTITLGGSFITYIGAHNKISGKATFDSAASSTFFGDAEEKGYIAHWIYEDESITYKFTTKEDHMPKDYETKTIKGYIDSNHELVVVSWDGFLGFFKTVFLGPIIFAGGIVYVISGSQIYERNKKEYDKEKAIIDERLATQQEYEAYVDSLK